MHLVAEANHTEYTFMGFKISRGQVVVGRKQLAADNGISEDQARTALKHLLSTNDITIKTTNKFSIVSIANYEIYQGNIPSNIPSKSPGGHPTNPQQIPTIKECKNDKNDKNRPEDFIEKLKANPTYKGLNIDRELHRMDAWLLLNKGRQKTARFVLNWLNRELEKNQVVSTPSKAPDNGKDKAQLEKWKAEASPMPAECREQLASFGIRSAL